MHLENGERYHSRRKPPHPVAWAVGSRTRIPTVQFGVFDGLGPSCASMRLGFRDPPPLLRFAEELGPRNYTLYGARTDNSAMFRTALGRP